MSKNKPFSYCFRVYDYEQYLHDVGELRAMGYSVDTKGCAAALADDPRFRTLYLHVDVHGDTSDVCMYDHTLLSERVPNLDYIINELPVFKTSSKAV